VSLFFEKLLDVGIICTTHLLYYLFSKRKITFKNPPPPFFWSFWPEVLSFPFFSAIYPPFLGYSVPPHTTAHHGPLTTAR